MVTGTDADLRKLSMKFVDKTILKYGDYNEEYLAKLTRWDKIDLLRQISSQYPNDVELVKYARSLRVTTKMQLERYQKDINKLFMSLIDNVNNIPATMTAEEDDDEIQASIDVIVQRELNNEQHHRIQSVAESIEQPNHGITTVAQAYPHQ